MGMDFLHSKDNILIFHPQNHWINGWCLGFMMILPTWRSCGSVGKDFTAAGQPLEDVFLERQVSGKIGCFLGEICPKIYSEWSLSSIANPWHVWFLHFQRKPVTRSTWCSLGTRQTCFPAVCKSFAAIVTVLLSPRKARRCWRISGSMKWRALWRACLETQNGCKAGG